MKFQLRTKQNLLNTPILLTTTVGGWLAFAVSFYQQGANARVGGLLGVQIVPIMMTIFTFSGQIATYVALPLLVKYRSKQVVSTALLLVLGSTFLCYFASTMVKFMLAYVSFNFTYQVAFVSIAILMRQMLPAEIDPQRRGGSFWSSVCYVFGASATFVLQLGVTAGKFTWFIIALCVPVLAMIMVWLIPLLPEIQLVREDAKSPRLRELLFDKKAARKVWPYVSIIMVSNLMLTFLQFHLGMDTKLWGFSAVFFILTVNQIVTGLSGVLATRLARRIGDRRVVLLAVLLALGSAICFVTDNVMVSLTGAILLGLALCLGRVSFSQLASTHAGRPGRGVAMYNGVAIKTGQNFGSVNGLLLTFQVVSLTTIWYIPMTVLFVCFAFLCFDKEGM